MTGTAPEQPSGRPGDGHWWASENPPPRPEPPTVPPEPEWTLRSVWRSRAAGRAALSPFPDPTNDSPAVQLTFLFGMIVAGGIAAYGGLAAAAGQPAVLAGPLVVAAIGVVLLRAARRHIDPKARALRMYAGRALLWTTIVVGALVYLLMLPLLQA